MSSLVRRIDAIYARHILPYVGGSFSEPRPGELRMLAPGINSYVSDKDWPPQPEWHRSWIATRKYRYQKGVVRECGVLAEALSAAPAFGGMRFDPERGLYATNAVKVYLREARGKKARHLADTDFGRHLAQWHEELAELRDACALPHVLVVFGSAIWPYAWQAFHPNHHGPRLGVARFEPVADDAPHRLNRVVLDRGEPNELVLVRLRHPAGIGRVGTAGWLRERRAFRELVARVGA